jgi:hypothetical protein
MAVDGGGEMAVGNCGTTEPVERGVNITRHGQVGKPETIARVIHWAHAGAERREGAGASSLKTEAEQRRWRMEREMTDVG